MPSLIFGKFCTIACLITWGLSLNCYSQSLSVEKFKGDASLPSAELYDIIEDHDGNKWVASDLGVFKITGNHLQHYTIKNGLEENVVLSFFKGLNNKIWLGGISGSLTLLENGSFQKIKADKKITDLAPKSHYIASFFQKSADEVIFTKALSSGEQYSLHGQNISVQKSKTPSLVNLEIFQNIFFLADFPSGGSLKTTQWLIKKEGKAYYFPRLFKRGFNQRNQFVQLNDSTIFISNTGEIVKLTNFKFTRSFELPEEILCMKSYGNDLYIGLHHKGLYILKDNRLQKLNIPELNKLSVTQILIDREGSIWFTTLEKGLFVCKMPKIQTIYRGENNVIKLVEENSKINLLVSHNQYLISGKTPLKLVSDMATINDIFVHEGQKYYVTYDGLFDTRQQKNFNTSTSFFLRGYSRQENIYLFFGNSQIYFFDFTTRSFKAIPFTDHIHCIHHIGNNEFWVGTRNAGIYKLMYDSTSKQFKITKLTNNFRVNQLLKINDDLIAAGTNERGVLLLNRNAKLLSVLPGLPQRINCFALHGQQLCIGTRLGLYVYDLNKKEVRAFNSSNFLPFDEVVDISIGVDNQCYIAGKYELVSMPVAGLKDTHLTIGLSVENPIDTDKRILLNQNDYLELSCAQNNYKAAQNVSYRFLLTNEHGETIVRQQSKENSLKTKLDAGKYDLRVVAFDTASLSTSNELHFNVMVPRVFYQTWWFIVVCVLAGLALVVLTTRQIIQNVKTKERQKRIIQQKINDLEGRALQAQMNPHFIFNAINSIQAFILQNQNDRAHYYLAEFAKLIRMILNNSRKKAVTVQDEIDLLKTYVSLEEQRLKKTFDFQVVVGPEIDPQEVVLSPMLLQPIIENAIWHGVNVDKNQPRTIRLSFERNYNLLKITIFNSGNPYEPLQNIQKHVHGLQIINERINLLYPNPTGSDNLIILNVPEGVEVRMILPFETEFD